MKRLLLILICLPIIGFGQCISGDCENGYGTIIYGEDSSYGPDGVMYIGMFENSNFHGQGSLIDLKDESKYVGEFKNGKRHGIGIKSQKNTNLYVGFWKDGGITDGDYWGLIKPVNGIHITMGEGYFQKDTIGSLIIERMTCEECDEEKLYYENGNINMIQSYKNSMNHGTWIKFYENGKLAWTSNYISDKWNGILKWWNEDGLLVKQADYINDKENGNTKMWYDNGKIKLDIFLINGKQNGLSKFWNENGLLINETYWCNDKEDGISKSWYDNGQLKWIENYKNGKLNGKAETWHQNGSVFGIGNFVNGKGYIDMYDENGNFLQKMDF
tara:strand:- start:675 stop:1661 length:987 start_codon:yes stop_codon:yes gene_type:complete